MQAFVHIDATKFAGHRVPYKYGDKVFLVPPLYASLAADTMLHCADTDPQAVALRDAIYRSATPEEIEGFCVEFDELYGTQADRILTVHALQSRIRGRHE